MKQLTEMTIGEMSDLYNWTWGRYRMRDDDDIVGLCAGEVVVCVGAGFDHEKLVALFAESDRRPIGHTLYREQVMTLGNYAGPRA